MLNGQQVEGRTMTEKTSPWAWLWWIPGCLMLAVMVVICGTTAVCRIARHKLAHIFRDDPEDPNDPYRHMPGI